MWQEAQADKDYGWLKSYVFENDRKKFTVNFGGDPNGPKLAVNVTDKTNGCTLHLFAENEKPYLSAQYYRVQYLLGDVLQVSDGLPSIEKGILHRVLNDWENIGSAFCGGVA